MSKTVVGLFEDFEEARSAVRELVGGGISLDNISVAANRRGAVYGDREELYTVERAREIRNEDSSDALASQVAPVGAALGGFGGMMTGLGSMTASGIGPLLGAGPLVAALAGMGSEASSVGLIDSLVGNGVPDKHARLYAEGVRRGATLVTVDAPEDRVRNVVETFDRRRITGI